MANRQAVKQVAQRVEDAIAGRDQKTWDAQIEADAYSGRLDALAAEALAERRTSRDHTC